MCTPLTPPVSLVGLTSLSELCCGEGMVVTSLPPSLTKLSCVSRSSESLDAFLNAVSAQLLELRDLVLMSSGPRVSRDQFQRILNACPKLRSATFRSLGIPSPEIVEVSHPKLSSVNFYESSCFSSRLLPKLRKADTSKGPQHSSAVLERPPPKIYEFCIGFHRSLDVRALAKLTGLRSVTLTNPTPVQFTSLQYLPRLEVLGIWPCDLTEEILASALPKFIALQSLRIRFAAVPSTLNWLVSPSISSLVLSCDRLPMDDDLEFANEGASALTSLEFGLLGSSVPRLSSVSAQISRCSTVAIKISGLPNLAEFNFCHFACQRVSAVHISDCPQLLSCSISSRGPEPFKSLQLEALPSLFVLELHFDGAASIPTILLKDTEVFPSLRSVKVTLSMDGHFVDSLPESLSQIQRKFEEKSPFLRDKSVDASRVP